MSFVYSMQKVMRVAESGTESQVSATERVGTRHRRVRLAEFGKFDPLLTSAAGAITLVVWMQAYHTLGSERGIVWVDALVNEGVIWFTILYLAFTATRAVVDRLGPLERYRRRRHP